ncbi:hypothetical protein H6P81_016549 [Aristolochia fimbriata]|uniref:Cytoplasmic tRNA 2-thiolation protein 2 n=1 Tax=Aristolochia fimbriata TaxID=158543 RepID=A0AAV7EAA2_ARIFI|nr:hypothetical protein H6P81_016549 [Aristolochia fimbriata]
MISFRTCRGFSRFNQFRGPLSFSFDSPLLLELHQIQPPEAVFLLQSNYFGTSEVTVKDEKFAPTQRAMACGQSACKSNCYKEEEDGNNQEENGRISGCTTTNTDSDHTVICSKCKEKEAVVPHNNHLYHDQLCLECFRSSLFGKFKLAVTSHSMISPHDKVLIGFSGGPASRVALQFVHEMQLKAHMNFEASRDRSLPVFGVGVAFVNESAVSSVPSHQVHQVNEAIKDMESIVSSLAPPMKEMYTIPLEGIFSEIPQEGKNLLHELLNTISDATGKEDFLQHLRMLSLQKFASDNGFSKLILGSCASRIACHVISATVKGQGYSLPADVQYVDARWKIPVVLPLRDCLAHELNLLCQLGSLRNLKLFDRPLSGINGQVSSFVALLQEENPSRERTIVRTAEKLTPFSFNKIPETDHANNHPSLPRRLKAQNLKSNESIAVDVFCAVCVGPLSASEMQKAKSGDQFAANCCQSCLFQILPKEPSALQNFYSLLPESMSRRVKGANGVGRHWLREKIADCLLSDDEAET